MYIDGFILPLRDDKLGDYKPMAEKFAGKAQALGALGSLEAIGDGLEHGHTTDFFKAVHAEDGENVVFSFVVWPDNEVMGRKSGLFGKSRHFIPAAHCPMPTFRWPLSNTG